MIKSGDLVAVILPTPCCGSVASIGLIGTVDRVGNKVSMGCIYCGAATDGFAARISEYGCWSQVYRLQKLRGPQVPALPEPTELQA